MLYKSSLHVYIMQNTALHYACFGGHVEAVQLLLEYKADVTVKNTYHQSPLDHAIDNLNSDVVTVMLRNKRYRQWDYTYLTLFYLRGGQAVTLAQC